MFLNTQTKNEIKHDLQLNLIPLLLGNPGIGKSTIIDVIAKELNTSVFTVQCNQLGDRSDLTGGRLVQKENTYSMAFFPHAEIADCIEFARNNTDKPVILFLDELNRGDLTVCNAALTLATARVIGTQQLPTNVRIIIAGNDKGDVHQLDTAAMSRFSVYHLKADGNDFVKYIEKVHPWIQSVLADHPELIECTQSYSHTENESNPFDFDTTMKQITSPRTLDYLNRWLISKSDDDLLELNQIVSSHANGISLLQELIEGKIGRTLFTKHLLRVINTSQLQDAPIHTASQTAQVAVMQLTDDILSRYTDINAVEQAIQNETDPTLKMKYLIGSLYHLLHPHTQKYSTHIYEKVFHLCIASNVDITQDDAQTILTLTTDCSAMSINDILTFIEDNVTEPIGQQISDILTTYNN